MKTFTKVSATLILAIAYTITASAVPITFQVNTSIQTALGNFNPATDTVVVAGDPVNGWSTTDSPLTSSTGNTNIWTGTFDVAGTTGATVQYKYVLNTAGGLVWEGNVGAGGGSGNRTFTLPAGTELVLPMLSLKI